MYIKFAKIEVKKSGNLTSKNSFIRHTFLNGTNPNDESGLNTVGVKIIPLYNNLNNKQNAMPSKKAQRPNS